MTDELDVAPADRLGSDHQTSQAVLADLSELGRFISCAPGHLRVESPLSGDVLLLYAQDDIVDEYDRLWRFLYSHHYCGEPAVFAPLADPMAVLGLRFPDPDFVHELARASLGRGWLDTGWVARGERDGNVVVEKNDVTLLAAPEDVVPDTSDGDLAEPSVSVRFPNGSAGRAPGFYHVTGDAGPQRDHPVFRVYLNLDAASAVATVARLQDDLNSRSIPFTMKITADRARFGRRDNTVLYLAGEDLERVLPVVTNLHAATPSAFRSESVLFARSVLPGVAVAEDVSSVPAQPGEDQPKWSFGESRCRVVARGLLVHRVAGCGSGCDMVELLADCFRQAGVNPASPDQVSSDALTDAVRAEIW